MPTRKSAIARVVTCVLLIAVGAMLMLSGGVLLLAHFLAIDPEDTVPVIWWLGPLALGSGLLGVGVHLADRDSGRPRQGVW